MSLKTTVKPRTPPDRVGAPFQPVDRPAPASARADVRSTVRARTASSPATAAEPPVGSESTAAVMLLLAVTLTAFVLRAFQSGSIFRSQDYAEIPFRVAHYWGWGWMLDSAYGPVQPLLTKLWALAVTSMGWPMSEALWRAPAILIGALSPLFMYLLLRQLGTAAFNALAAANLLAIAPFAVSADRYPYSAETFGLCFALLSLWLAARQVRGPSRATGWMLGVGAAVCLLSHLLLHAFPVALAAVAWCACRAPAGRERLRSIRRALLRPGVVLPPLAALGLLIASYARTGDGQLGHLLFKQSSAQATLTGPADWAQHGLWLVRQFGWIGAAAIVLTLPAAFTALRRGRPAGAFLMWALAFLLPVVLLHRYTGRMYGYYLQPCAALLAMACLAWRPLNRLIPRASAVAGLGLVTVSMLAGTVSTVFAGDRWQRWTGVSCPIGATTPDPGYKAAGWYVRSFVPGDWVIFTPHEADGLEAMNAAYYLGRHCLAGENFTLEQARRVYERFADRIDAAVVEPRFDNWFRGDRNWRCAARVARADGGWLRIYVRPGRRLPVLTMSAVAERARFDEQCAPRRLAAPLTPSPRLPRPSEIAAAAGRG